MTSPAHSIALGLALLITLGTLGGRAAAQPAAAEAAFQRGRALLKDGKIAEACDAFATSQRIEPQLGTRYNLGLCWARLGKTASAWTALREVAQRDTNPTRKAQAAARAAELEPALVTASLRVAAPPPGLVITANAEDLTKLVGLAFPIDPGEYQIVARAPGYRDYTAAIVAAGPGTTVRIDIPALAPIPEPAAPAPVAAPAASALTARSTVTAAAPPAHDRRRWLGVVTASGGGVAIAAGMVAGYLAHDRWNAAKSVCGPDLQCASTADRATVQGMVDAARLRGNVATGLVVAGVAAAGLGAVLWLTAPPGREQPRAAWRVAPASDGRAFTLALDGRF